MLNLGRILISDLIVTNLFMYSLPGMILLYLAMFFTLNMFLHKISSLCKVNYNCYKQQINTSSWEIPGKVPNTLQLNYLHLLNTQTAYKNFNFSRQYENICNLYWLASLWSVWPHETTGYIVPPGSCS